MPVQKLFRNIAVTCATILWTIAVPGLRAVQLTEPSTRQPIRVGASVQESKLRHRVEPVYPQEALDSRISGVVILQVIVNEGGNVSDVKVLRGHPLLDKAAADAVMQWQYEPTHLNGEPVPVTATVSVTFSAEDKMFRLILDDSGVLRDASGQLEGSRLLQKAADSKYGVLISAGSRVALREIENQVAFLDRSGVSNVRVLGYEMHEGQLFSVIRPDIQPPELSLDYDRLAAIAASSDLRRLVPPGQNRLLYRLFISQAGAVIAARPVLKVPVPVIEAELMRTTVSAPGRRAGEPLPVVFIVEIPIP